MNKKLDLQQRCMFRKGKSAVKGDPNKSWSGIEAEGGVEQKEVGLEVNLVQDYRKEVDLTFNRIERKIPVLTRALHSNQSSLCSLHCGRD